MITFKHRGNFNRTDTFFRNAKNIKIVQIMETYGRQGVAALSSATPKDTGLTSASWNYEIKPTKYGYNITWTNSNQVNGIPIVILIQYGHGTPGGTFVEGIDFINPATKSVLDDIAENLWREVTKL